MRLKQEVQVNGLLECDSQRSYYYEVLLILLELQQRVTSNVESILKKQHSLPAKLPHRVLVNATVPKLKIKSYSSG